MYPILLKIGSITVYSYGFMLALGVGVSLILIMRKARKEGIDEEAVLDLTIITVLSGLIGARLFYVFFYDWEYYRLNPLQILDFRNEGLVWYGAFILGAAAALLYVRIKRLSFWRTFDLFAPYLALGYAFGRIGCFLNGCCFGTPTDLPWGVVFPGLDAVPRHPAQLYSTLLSLGLFAFLLWLYPRRRFDGQVFLAYIIGYALLRFGLEFVRENLIIWGSLSIAQVVAAGLLVIAGLIYWRRSRTPLGLDDSDRD